MMEQVWSVLQVKPVCVFEIGFQFHISGKKKNILS